VEVTPEGYMLQEVSVPVKGKTEGREPEWFRFRPEVGHIQTVINESSIK
jgi:hypothetical protein